MRCSMLLVLTGLLALASTGAARAQSAQTTLSVGAVVVARGCTMSPRLPGQPGPDAVVRCAGQAPASVATLVRSGGLAGPDGADVARVTIAY